MPIVVLGSFLFVLLMNVVEANSEKTHSRYQHFEFNPSSVALSERNLASGEFQHSTSRIKAFLESEFGGFYEWHFLQGAKSVEGSIVYMVTGEVLLKDARNFRAENKARKQKGLSKLPSEYQLYIYSNEVTETIKILLKSENQAIFPAPGEQTYGCLFQQPILFQDLNHDGKSEIFLVTGYVNANDAYGVTYETLYWHWLDGKSLTLIHKEPLYFLDYVHNQNSKIFHRSNMELDGAQPKTSTDFKKKNDWVMFATKIDFTDSDKDGNLEVLFEKKYFQKDTHGYKHIRAKQFSFTWNEKLEKASYKSQKNWGERFPNEKFCRNGVEGRLMGVLK